MASLPDFLAKVFGRSSEVAEVAGKAAGKGAQAETAAARVAEEVRLLNAQNAWPIEAIEKQYGKFSPIAKRAREANPEELKHIQSMLHSGNAPLLKSNPAEFERLLNEKIGGKGGRSLTPPPEPTPVGLMKGGGLPNGPGMPNGGVSGPMSNGIPPQPIPDVGGPRPRVEKPVSGPMQQRPKQLPAVIPPKQPPAVIPQNELATIPDRVRQSASTPLEIVDELGHPVPQERGLMARPNGPTIDVGEVVPKTPWWSSVSRAAPYVAPAGVLGGAGVSLFSDWASNRSTGMPPNFNGVMGNGQNPSQQPNPASPSGKSGTNIPYQPQPAPQPSPSSNPVAQQVRQYTYNNHDSKGNWISDKSDFEGLNSIAAEQTAYFNKHGMATAAQNDRYIEAGLRHPDRNNPLDVAAPQYNAMQQAIQRLGVGKQYGQGQFIPDERNLPNAAPTPSTKGSMSIGASDVAGNVAAPTPAPAATPAPTPAYNTPLTPSAYPQKTEHSPTDEDIEKFQKNPDANAQHHWQQVFGAGSHSQYMPQ